MYNNNKKIIITKNTNCNKTRHFMKKKKILFVRKLVMEPVV